MLFRVGELRTRAPGRPLPDVADLAEQWYKNVAKTTETLDFHIVL
jgi:hypothetical protein